MKNLLLALCLLPLVALAAPSVQLADGGKPLHAIHVAADADEAILAHAATLAEQLERITGAPFVVAEGDGRQGIAIGTPANFPALGVDKELRIEGIGERESYLLRSHADGLYVIGNTPIAVQHGLWDLLHRLGYRQFLPGAVWEHVPRLPDAAITVDAIETPHYFVRRIWYGYGTWDVNQATDRQWHIRNRGVSDFRLNTGHAYEHIISVNQKAFDENPQYYGLLNGERKSTKICVGNPDLRALVVAHARNYFIRSPDADSISVDPSDGGGWCECTLCLEVGTASDRALTLANDVSDMLEAEFPGKYVAMYAYSEHAEPPNVMAKPRVIISAATAFLRGANVLDYIAGWQAQGVLQFGIREYYGVNVWDRDLPGAPRGSRLDYLTKTIPEFHSRGARFMSSESSDNWGVSGLGYYLASRLLWDVNEAARVEEIVDDFLTTCFGPAAEPMRSFYAILTGSVDTKLTSDLLGRMYGSLEEAMQAAGDDPAIRARLDHLLLYTRYVEIFRDYANNRGPARQAAFELLIRHAYRIRTTHMVHSLALYRDLTERDGSVHIPMEAHWQKPEGNRPEEPKDDLEGMLNELEDVLVARPEPVYNPWKSSEPWQREELATILRDGLANNPTIEFEDRAFSNDLVPSTPLALEEKPLLTDSNSDRGNRKYYIWVDEAPGRFTFKVTGGLIAHYRDRGPAKLRLHHGESTTPVSTGESAPDGQTRDITLTTPYKGLHWLIASDGSDRTTIVFPEGVWRTSDFSTTAAGNHSGRRYGYFYVPKGTRVIGGFSSCSTGFIRNPDGEAAIEFTGNRDYFSIDVAEGHDGRLWQIDGTSGGLQLLTVPPYICASAAHLLLPREVVEKDRPRE